MESDKTLFRKSEKRNMNRRMIQNCEDYGWKYESVPNCTGFNCHMEKFKFCLF